MHFEDGYNLGGGECTPGRRNGMNEDLELGDLGVAVGFLGPRL